MTWSVAALAAAASLVVPAQQAEISSEGTFVFLAPETSSFWTTATNSTMSLPVYYPDGAAKATLTVKGLGYYREYSGIASDTIEISLPEPDSPKTENVYDLTLVFDDGTVRVAKLGLIQGCTPDAEGMTRCIAPSSGASWEKVKYRAVLPIPHGTTSLSLKTDGGEWREIDTGLNGAQGWHALGPVARGDRFALSCVVDGVTHVSPLRGAGDGLFVTVK